jgi:acetyl-CoA C-acetyltransferase
MEDVVIVDAVRSPIGKKNGSFALMHPASVLAQVMKQALARNSVESSAVGQVIGGCIGKVGAQAMNITRTAWLAHGGDENIACSTVDSQCGSSQYAVNLASMMISSGTEDVVLACGVENLSRIPIGADAAAGAAAGMGNPLSRDYLLRYEWVTQFEAAERIAEKYAVTRQDCDDFGLESQIRAARAVAEGRFDNQIVPIAVPVKDESGKRTDETILVTKDEIPRDSSIEQLANLKPVAREDGVHTAGSSSQLADGAAAVLMMSARRAEELGLTPIARVAETALVGCDPVLMLEGPIPAARQILHKSGLSIDDIDVTEINEAFASIVLAYERELQQDPAKVNPNGGAISLGHPLGATGCFLVTKAVHELQRTTGRYGFISMCCGGGLGTGTLIERA